MTRDALLALLRDLSLEEKIGQLSQIPVSAALLRDGVPTGPLLAVNLSKQEICLSGTLICDVPSRAEETQQICRELRARHPHRIPTMVMKDVVHGMRTIFPIPLAMGCTFDEGLAREMARIGAKEGAAAGLHATFAPMVDVVRDPRWGRCMESPGEAPALVSAMGRAMVEGFRGSLGPENLACCAKHFAAYGLAQAGQDYMPVDVSHTEIHNTYLPPFRAALAAGCDMIMPAFTPIDRRPAAISPWLMNRTLREDWGWQGVAISDYDALEETCTHGVTADLADAAAQGMDAQLDIDMMSMAYQRELPQLVRSGRVSMEALDRAVLRVLEMKNRLGLFEQDQPTLTDAAQARCFADPAHQSAALEAALRACVLLKNEGLLPLKPGTKVALTGSMADAPLLGGWSADGDSAACPTLRDALSACNAVSLCLPGEADVIIAAMGEPQEHTGESMSKIHLALTETDRAELTRLKAMDRPVAMVIFSGRPLMIADALPLCDAVLAAWFPGSMGAEALRMLLLGERNPSGHLAMTWPRAVGQIPIHHDRLSTGRPSDLDHFAPYRSSYIDENKHPLYPFGYGLSYTRFEMTAEADRDAIAPGERARMTVRLRNTGDRDGETVVQLYARMQVSPLMQPEKRLIGWRRVAVPAGGEACVTLDITQAMLTLYDHDGRAVPPQGLCRLAVGECSDAPFTHAILMQP